MNSSSIAKRYAVVALATLAASLAMDHAGATEPNQEPRSVVVRFADLDLSRPKDAQALYDRLHAAARLVCEDAGNGLEDLAHLRQYKDCIDRALANAVTDVGSAKLTAIRQAVNR
jgi:UrcA family protein